MNLVVNKVVQLHHIDVPYRSLLVERLARSAVVKLGLQGRWYMNEKFVVRRYLIFLLQFSLPFFHKLIRLGRKFLDIVFGRAVKHRCNGTEAQYLCHPAKMRLENLANIHSARNTQRIQQYVKAPAVFEERHVLFRHNLGDDTLVAVAAGHLVTY